MTWRVARSLDILLEQINKAYPDRSKVSDGSIGNAAHAARQSDHNPDQYGVVHARDFTHDPVHGFDSYKFADDLLRAQDKRVKYIISNGRIGGGPLHHATPSSYCPEGIKPNIWTKYAGPNQHDHHVHVSVLYNASADFTTPWAVPIIKPEDTLSDVVVKNPSTGKEWPIDGALWSIWTYVIESRNLAGQAVALAKANSQAMAEGFAEVAKQTGIDPEAIKKVFSDAVESAMQGQEWTLKVDPQEPPA